MGCSLQRVKHSLASRRPERLANCNPQDSSSQLLLEGLQSLAAGLRSRLAAETLLARLHIRLVLVAQARPRIRVAAELRSHRQGRFEELLRQNLLQERPAVHPLDRKFVQVDPTGIRAALVGVGQPARSPVGLVVPDSPLALVQPKVSSPYRAAEGSAAAARPLLSALPSSRHISHPFAFASRVLPSSYRASPGHRHMPTHQA